MQGVYCCGRGWTALTRLSHQARRQGPLRLIDQIPSVYTCLTKYFLSIVILLYTHLVRSFRLPCFADNGCRPPGRSAAGCPPSEHAQHSQGARCTEGDQAGR